MKKITYNLFPGNRLVVLIVLFTSIAFTNVNAQHFEFKPTIGLRTGGNINTPSGLVMPRENVNWQLIGGYTFRSGIMLDFSYMTGPSTIKFRERSWHPWEIIGGDLRVNHVMAGIGFENTVSDAPISPFGVLRLGNMQINSADPRFDSFSRFTFSIEGGVKMAFTPWFGLVTHINMMMPVQWNPSQVFNDSQNVYNFEASPGLIAVQFGINTGFYFNF